MNTNSLNKLFKQEQIILELNNSNVIKTFGSFTSSDEQYGYFVMELALGSLRSFKLKMIEDFDDSCKLYVMHSISAGLAYVHRERIIYMDLKDENLLIMPDGAVKLSDFGLAQCMREYGWVDEPKYQGTPAYMAPEVIAVKFYTNQTYNAKADIFSFGSLAHKLFFGKTPNRELWDTRLTHDENLRLIQNQTDLSGHLTDKFFDTNWEYDNRAFLLIKRCLFVNAEDRPTAKKCSDFLTNHFSANIDQGKHKISCIARGFDKATKVIQIGRESNITISIYSNSRDIDVNQFHIYRDSELIDSLSSTDFTSMRIICWESALVIGLFYGETRMSTLNFNKSCREPQKIELDKAFNTSINQTFCEIRSDGLYMSYFPGKRGKNAIRIKSITISDICATDRPYKVSVEKFF